MHDPHEQRREQHPDSAQRTGHEVLIALRRIIRAIDLHSSRLLHRCGLTGPQLLLLQELGDGEISAGALAERVCLSQATVTGILDRLQRRGLVTRRRDQEDRRRVLAAVTPAGRQLLHRAPPLLQESFLAQLSKLQDWEQTLILSSLQRVVAMMEARSVEASPILTTEPLGGAGMEATVPPATARAGAPQSERPRETRP